MPRTTDPSKSRELAQEPAWATPNLREPRYSQSLERGLAILASFTAERPVMGIADLADELGMSRSTTHRYVITLVALGYLEQVASRKYRLGLRVTDLGMSALSSTGLREVSHPFLQELRERTGCTVSLAVLDGADVLYVDHSSGYHPAQRRIDLDRHPGSRVPAYCTAMGKLLLSGLPESRLEELLDELKPTKRGPNTITSKKALRSELDEARAAGFAVGNEELAPARSAIAAPIRDASDEVVAALDISAHASTISLNDMIDAHLPQLTSIAKRISARLGHTGGAA